MLRRNTANIMKGLVFGMLVITIYCNILVHYFWKMQFDSKYHIDANETQNITLMPMKESLKISH